MSQLKRHLNPATVISCVALFVALGGAAYAVSPLGNKAVKTKNLANGSVNALKLRGGAVTTLKLRNGAVTGPKIAPGAVGTNQLADGGVRSADLGGGVVTTAKLKDEAVTSQKIRPENVITQSIKVGAVTEFQIDPRFRSQLAKNVIYVSSVTPTFSSTSKGTSATCSGPQRQVIGGGARVLGTNTKIALLESGPVSEAPGKPPTNWSVRANELEPGPEWALEAVAICADF